MLTTQITNVILRFTFDPESASTAGAYAWEVFQMGYVGYSVSQQNFSTLAVW